MASTVAFSSWRSSSKQSERCFCSGSSTLAHCARWLPDNMHLNNTHTEDVHPVNQIKKKLKSASTFQEFWCQDYFRTTAPLIGLLILPSRGWKLAIPKCFFLLMSWPMCTCKMKPWGMFPMTQIISLPKHLLFQATVTLSRKNIRIVCAPWGVVCCWLSCSIKCKSMGYCTWGPWCTLYLLYTVTV